MDRDALDRALRRIEEARAGGTAAARFDAALERSRAELESLARATSELESLLPGQVGDAVREGVAREVVPVARTLAEIKGLQNQALRRLERLEEELYAERNARIDDLAVLVELVSVGWQGVDARLARLERSNAGGQVVPLRAESPAAIAQ